MGAVGSACTAPELHLAGAGRLETPLWSVVGQSATDAELRFSLVGLGMSPIAGVPEGSIVKVGPPLLASEPS